MKQNILGMSLPACKRLLKRQWALCIAVAVLALALNIVFTAGRNGENHSLMLFLNIAADALAGCFLVFYLYVRILPRRRLYRMMCRYRSALSGVPVSIGAQTLRYMDIDCYPVELEGQRLFLPAGALRLEAGCFYSFQTVSNMIVEAEK